ncbi:ankyrin repeat-containing domain protein [Biscogniauxia mediterranea]|nr:ankyrin repeat-containing domain protein [Biscogniauxia mediterranea]
MQLLIEYGADINAKNDGGQTTLYLAVVRGRKDITQLLIECGADIKVQNDDDDTSLWEALRQAITYTPRRAYHAFISPLTLLAHPARLRNKELPCAAPGEEVDLEYVSRMTSLQLAVLWGVEELVRLLIERGDDVNARTRERTKELHH